MTGAVPDNTSPLVSITARFEQEVEMLGARPPSTHRPGIMFQHVGLFMLMHPLLWCVLRKEKEGRVS